MGKPWIGIPTRYNETTKTFGQIRHYLEAVLWAGGVPLLIPTIGSLPVSEYIERIDGILLPGNPTDVDPAHYQEQPHPRLGKIYPERDALDFALLKHGHEAGIPILGICFGAQSLSVFRGGKLIQDIPSSVPAPIVHESSGTDPSRHVVRFDRDSLLARLAGLGPVQVVSDHHQSIRHAGKELKVVATAPDGVVEAVEDTRGRFVIGVQWHPEIGWADDPFSKAVFSALVQEASKSQSRRHSV